MSAAVKRAAVFVAALTVIPWLAAYCIGYALCGRVQAFVATSQRASRWAGLWGAYRRRTLLRWTGADVASDCHIEIGTLLSKPTVVIAPGVYIGAYCCLGDVRIGPKTMIADGVHIPSGPATHGTARSDIPMADQPGQPRTVTIGGDCWIGSAAVVLADIADHAIVAAGAVVTHPVDEGSIVAGVPAEVIGRRE
jgi:acetyltransferase-like isoleucine patch superfamily enzyme